MGRSAGLSGAPARQGGGDGGDGSSLTGIGAKVGTDGDDDGENGIETSCDAAWGRDGHGRSYPQ